MCDHKTDGIWYWKGKPWVFSFENAHSIAKNILNDDYFWRTDDPHSPFGDSNGIDTMIGFIEWRAKNPYESVYHGFLYNLFKKHRFFDLFVELGFEPTFPSKSWFDFFYPSCDEIIVATALSQLILEGKINHELIKLALESTNRLRSDRILKDLYRAHVRKEGMNLIEQAFQNYKYIYLQPPPEQV